MATKIQIRNDISTNWSSVNPILMQGEEGVETNTKKYKVGDGLTAWNSLPYFNTFSSLDGKPTTASGYGITDVYTKTAMQTNGSALMHWNNITNKPNFADSSWKTAVATKESLPLTGNILNDQRVVLNDGDGKQAIYLCRAITGDVNVQWAKTADVDWMTEEQTRITQENARVSAETSRITLENNRVSNESSRQSNETVRQNNESTRSTAEINRIDAETLRDTDETERISMESTRQNNETTRQSKETIRQLNEVQRESAEDIRQSTFDVNEAERSAWNDKVKVLDAMDIKLGESIDNLAESAKSVIPDVSVSTYARVSSLSEKAREGQMNATVKGNTLKNEVVNGNFANGTTGWQSTVTLTALNNVLTFIANAQYVGATKSVVVKSGHKYYASSFVKATSNLVRFAFYKTVDPWSLPVNISHSGSGNYERLSSIGIAPTENDWVVRVRDENTSGWALVGVKDVICIDMGADASNPLFNKTVAEMDLIAPLYFDGLASVVAGQIKSAGKNRFDKSNATKGYYTNTTGGLTAKATSGTSDYILVAPLEVCTKTTTTLTAFFDVNKTFISYVDGSTFTAPITAKYIRFNFVLDNIDVTQLEHGSIATQYEPYTETVRSLPSATLRSLPNGVTDYVDAMQYVKNCETYTLAGSDIGSLNTTPTNVDYVSIALSKFAGVKSQAVGIDGCFVVEGFSPEVNLGNSPDWDLTNSIGRWGTSTDYLYLFFAKGTYATLAAAQTALTGKKLIYQLATPIITELFPEPLKSSPKGSIIYENVRREIGTYGTNATVSNTSAPIKTMRKLYKVLADGTKMPISVITGITVASDGLSWTHTSLIANDNIEWKYEFDSALSTTPLIKYDYVNDASDFPSTNLVTNGSFLNAVSPWYGYYATLSVLNNVLSITGTGSVTEPKAKVDCGKISSGHKIYVRASMRALSAVAQTLMIQLTNGTTWLASPTQVDAPTQNQWYALSGIYPAISDISNLIVQLRTYYLTADASIGQTTEAKYALVLDLTAIFGAGKEPSLAEMDAIMALFPNSWFDGTVNPILSSKDIWNLKAGKTQEPWITPTMLNGWTEASGYPVRYMKDSMGFVHIKGRVTGGTINTSCFNLPDGYRPIQSLNYASMSNSAFAVYAINSFGSVIPSIGSTTNFHIDNAAFKAEA